MTRARPLRPLLKLHHLQNNYVAQHLKPAPSPEHSLLFVFRHSMYGRLLASSSGFSVFH
jgi:hypothetical protein